MIANWLDQGVVAAAIVSALWFLWRPHPNKKAGTCRSACGTACSASGAKLGRQIELVQLGRRAPVK